MVCNAVQHFKRYNTALNVSRTKRSIKTTPQEDRMITRELTSEMEFQIDVDFQNRKTEMFINGDDDLFPEMGDEDDSDGEDTLRNIEETTKKMMLASPDYLSFEELGANMIDCMSTGDVKMLIIEEGKGPLVPVDSEVTIHYAAYWEKAVIPFDSTLTMNMGAPKRLRLGTGKIIPGLEIGLTMVKGPQARLNLLVQPAAAWGPRGVPPRIRPEPALFVIVLYDVKDNYAATRFNDLPMAEQTKYEVTLRTVNALRADAKELYKKKKYVKAIKNYQQAISVLRLSRPGTADEELDIKNNKVNAYLNLAVCYYKTNKPKHVLNMCECLDRLIDTEKHCKALYYYGKAHEMLGKTEMAIKYYKKALKLEPKNKEIGKILADLDTKTKDFAVNEKAMWLKAFNVEVPATNAVYDVDATFQSDVLDMCQSLAGRSEFAKFDLPVGLTKNEVDCIKGIVSDFGCLSVDVSGEGRNKKVCIVKKIV
ncbi:inactive peptidyl-prolyl cis-trans isomerase shutdown-like isoform X1 [Bombyx mori]